MTGTTTGQISLATATDSDDVEVFLTGNLTTDLQTLVDLFHNSTGHAHNASGKGAPIGTAGIASGITLTSPHMTTPVVDSGGLTITAGGLTVTAGGLTVTAGGVTVPAGGVASSDSSANPVASSGTFRNPNNVFMAWRNAANSANKVFGYTNNDDPRLDPGTASTVGAAGGASALPATPLGYAIFDFGGTRVKVPYYNT